MLWRIGPYELDGERFELRHDGATIAVEPQVLSVLIHLVVHRDQLVTRDELVDSVWNGRIVSDAAISSRIKSARHALGDSGDRQTMIRTVHGKGFRFVHDVETAVPAAAAVSPAPAAPARPSIAVLPFNLVGVAGQHGVIAEALPHDLITDLSRLRWLFVIARGSSFQLRAADPDIGQVGAVLGVNYCLSGTIEVIGARLVISVELADTRDRGVIWSARHNVVADEIHAVRAHISASVIAALEVQIPRHEAQIARLRAPEQLDAWSSYHLGLQHMYRFNQADNAEALRLFEHAVAREPDFARAHGGLSFCHFQTAFVGYAGDNAAARTAARHHAETALAIDSLDPFANFTMGRSLWLTGDVEQGNVWLDQAIALNPNYAQAIYARAWAQTIGGNGASGRADADNAMALSPIDPLRYAMLATRALAHLVDGEDAEACIWADRAAVAPGAHVHILVIAAVCQMLAGAGDKAQFWAAEARRRNPSLTQADFFRSFPFSAARPRIAAGLTALGF